jgi:hypothetical protein
MTVLMAHCTVPMKSGLSFRSRRTFRQGIMSTIDGVLVMSDGSVNQAKPQVELMRRDKSWAGELEVPSRASTV